jgi:hypothetical protein
MDRSLPRATPALAKAAWQRQRHPSTRTVARALTQAGRPVHFSTVSRWRAQGWRKVANDHPLDVAGAALNSAVPLLTGSPATVVQDLVNGCDDKETLERLSDVELLRRAAREGLIALIIVARAIQDQANLLINRPAELAALVKALAAGFQVTANAFKQVFFLRGASEDFGASRTSTDGDCTENNPLDQALEAWTKNRP